MTTREHRLERIEALLAIGRYADAEVGIRSELALAPDSAELHHLLARALVCQDRAPAALEHARIAAALEPESADILHLYAGTLAEVGDGQQAYAVAVRSVQLAPDEWRSHFAVAHALTFGVRGLPALRAAETAAHRAVTLAPTEPDTHVLYGIVRWRLDDFTVAAEAFRNALAIDPQHADAQRNLASLQLDRGELEDGALTLSRALATSPQDDALHASLGTAAAAVLLHTAMVAAFATMSLGTLYFWIPSSVFVPLAGGAAFAVVAPLVAPFKNLPPGSWRLMVPRRATRHELPVLIFGWSVLGVCCVAWFPPSRVALVVALSTLAALLALGVLFVMRSSSPNSPGGS